MARTFPTAGMSPVDVYLAPTYKQGAVGLPAGYFEVAPTIGSYRAASCCSLYAKVDLGTGVPSVSGRVSVIEGRLDIGVALSPLSTMSVLCLDFNNQNVYQSINNVAASYIALRDRTAGSEKMNNLFNFMDITPTAGGYNNLFAVDGSGSTANTHTLRFMAGNDVYYIMVTNAPPT